MEIPKSMKINPIVHVEQIKPYISDNQPGRYKPKPSKVIINGEDKYEVQEIIDHRTTKRASILFIGRDIIATKPIGNPPQTWSTAKSSSKHSGRLRALAGA